MSGETYLHGNSDVEQERLALMNGILNERCLKVVAPSPGERVLELGAGTGIFAGALARKVTAKARGMVLGIELDERQFIEAAKIAEKEPALEIRQGTVYDPPLSADEWESFDLVHARFLLEHLARPGEAVEMMLRAARPGGRIVIVDDDHSLMLFDPNPGAMTTLFNDYALQFERLGHHPFIGRRLVSLLHAAGAQVVETTQVNFGGCAGQRGFGALVENLAVAVAGAREGIIATGSWTATNFDAAIAEFRGWSERPDATIWYALPTAVAIRPPA